MASSDKKVRKEQKKRDRAKREAAREKRRQLRAAVKEPQGEIEYVDQAHDDLLGGCSKDAFETASFPTEKAAGESEAANPAIELWWEGYTQGDGQQRLSMVRAKLGEKLDDEWREAIFPESVFEAERASEPADYAALLETLASDHRDLYELELLWFLRSRVTHYLAVGDHEKIEDVVRRDAASMTKTGEGYFGVVSMLRLAGLTDAADTLAVAGFGVLDNSELMPWAYDEVFHFFMDSNVRRCVRDGGDAKAMARMESILEENDANMDADWVLLRAEMVRRLIGKTKTKWVRNQLIGTDQKSAENRWLLSFEFSRWLVAEQGIAAIAADELRGLILETLSNDKLTMRSYLDGISRSVINQHLARLLGFMSLDRFRAPATLIAAEHFVRFLSDAALVKASGLKRSLDTIEILDSQLRRVPGAEWSSFAFLEPLRTSGKKT